MLLRKYLQLAAIACAKLEPNNPPTITETLFGKAITTATENNVKFASVSQQ